MAESTNPSIVFASMDIGKLDPMNLLKSFSAGGLDIKLLTEMQWRSLERVSLGLDELKNMSSRS